jgi:dipeptidyl aminopeptidase/acylaminoacyl peptidase
MKNIVFPIMLMITSLLSQAQDILTPERMWLLGRVGEMQVSPDGQRVIYTVTSYELSSNKGNSDVYSVPVNGGKPVQLTSTVRSEFNLQWRADGLKIGYLLADEDGTPQMWEMNPDGTDAKQLTRIGEGLVCFSYSPKMDNVLYVRRIKLDKTPKEVYPDLPLADARIIDDLMYRHWDNWHDYSYNHIFVAGYNTGKVSRGKDIMKGELYDAPMLPHGGIEQIAWSPDGAKIVYVCKKLKGKEYAESTNSEIYIHDIKEQKTECLSSNGFEGYDFDPVFSPDGSQLAWRSMKTPGFEADKEDLIIYNFKSQQAQNITADIDQSFTNYVWAPGGKFIYAISGINATYQVYQIDIAKKQVKQITEGKHNYQSIGLAGRNLVGQKMSMSRPSEIFKVDLPSGKETQLSFTNNGVLDSMKLAKVEERWIETTDGKKMLVWVIFPPEFDPSKKYPALLYCQGGPQSAVSQFWSYRWNFQLMAANGYIVVAPNRRGLPTFGQAWNNQISGDYGGQNMKDYLSAIDAVAKEPYVNKDKMGAVGASYGGFSVYWLAGNHQKRFKAFISHCGMFNLESQYGATEEYFFVNHDLEGPYWESPRPKSYDYSPHRFVDKWDTPIMIIHGERDYRIPYTESLQAFNAAKLKGVPARLLLFPNETHFILKPQNSILWNREFFGFLDKYLK